MRIAGSAQTSAIHGAHHVWRVAIARRHVEGECGVQNSELRRRQPNSERADVLVKILAPLGTGDRHDVVALRQHPRQRQLRRRTADLGSQGPDLIDQGQIAREVLALETRRRASVVVGSEILGALDPRKRSYPTPFA